MTAHENLLLEKKARLSNKVGLADSIEGVRHLGPI
jgi:hypothetical protein